MEIYISYNFKYFHQKYKMSYYTMWEKYKQLKRKQYDWFIVVNGYDCIYVKSTYKELLSFIDNIDKDKKWITIENLNITDKDYYEIPRFHKFYYDENMNLRSINHHYYYKDYEIGVKSDNEEHLNSIQFIEDGSVLYMRLDFLNCIEFRYTKDGKTYWVNYDIGIDKWQTTRPITLREWQHREMNKDDQDAIIKILKKMSNKQYKDFYKYDIDYVCNLLSIKI